MWREHILLNPWSQSVLPSKQLSLSFHCQSQYQSLPAHLLPCDRGFSYECYLWLPLLFHSRPHIPACHHSCVTWCIVSLFPPRLRINCSFIFHQDKRKKKAGSEHNSLKVVWIIFKQNNSNSKLSSQFLTLDEFDEFFAVLLSFHSTGWHAIINDVSCLGSVVTNLDYTVDLVMLFAVWSLLTCSRTYPSSKPFTSLKLLLSL